MIPDIDPSLIENSGEQRFYEAACTLPPAYRVYYSYKFSAGETAETPGMIYEADFIIVHPYLGYLVVEVKEGQYHYFGSRWQKQLGGEVVDLQKDPLQQAERAKYSILNKYRKEGGRQYFPLKFRHALCFPDCLHLAGHTPDNLPAESIILGGDLGKLEQKIRAIFGGEGEGPEEEAVAVLDRVLAPSFRVFSDLVSRIEIFHERAEKVLTGEQERILEETDFDRRKIFLGAAGSGKTFIAMEKVRRLLRDNRKVLLTCFNRNLGFYLRRELAGEGPPGLLTATNFHDLLINFLAENGQPAVVPDDAGMRSAFFRDELPELAYSCAAGLAEENKFDALVVDEGQDFHEEWFLILQEMLKGGEEGEFYIFADPGQNIFNPDADALASFRVSRHRLTRNLRNTEPINDWLTSLLGGRGLHCTCRGGIPVGFFPWESPEAELRLVEKELGRLVSQRVQPGRVVILSPHVQEKSAFAGRARIGEWPLVDAGSRQKENRARPSNAVKFYTIRSFKGLEADIVFLVGIRAGSQACTPGDIYVGCSRARFLLYIFHQEGYPFLRGQPCICHARKGEP